MYPGSTGGTVEVKVVLGRRLTSNIMTVFMPSILLNIIGHSTNYYKPQYFDAGVAVNLMVMLMITTLFIGINQSLPKTSDIKMVDYWLVFNLLISVVEVLMQVYRESLELTEIEDNKKQSHFKNILVPIPPPGAEKAGKETIDDVDQCQTPGQETNNGLVPVKSRKVMTDSDKYRYSQFIVKTIFPVIVLLFMCIYWIIGLCLYYKPNI